MQSCCFSAFSDEAVPSVSVVCPFVSDLQFRVLASGDNAKLGKVLVQTSGISVQVKYIAQVVTMCSASSRSMFGRLYIIENS